MASLPTAPNPADYKKPIYFLKHSIDQDIEIEADARLLGIVDNENGTFAIFVREGEAAGYAEAVAAYNNEINSLINQAAKDGVYVASLDQLRQYVNGELTAEEDVPVAGDPADFLSLVQDVEDDDE